MRPQLVVLALAALVLAALAGRVSAQSPQARAAAEAAVAAGDLGSVGLAAARDDGRDRDGGGVQRSGLTIASGGTSARATRAGGDASARAEATAEGVSLFDGLVTVERVTRTAIAANGAVELTGAVTGLAIGGEPRGDLERAASWTSGGAEVIANTGGAGLRVRLTRAVAGFASGTTVTIAEVSAEAVDGADPAPTPAPAPAPTAVPTPAPDDPLAQPAAPARRRASAKRRLARGRFVFPVYGDDVRCADDFGAPRAVIGAHQGNDCFAAFGSPVLAVADGTLNRVGTLPISGNRLWLETDRGDAFFYAHLSAFGPEAVSGRRVKAGTLLGFTGNTGDAEPTPPHVHFEIHPGDRRAIDPHAILRAWQTHGELPSGGWLARYGGDTEARPGTLVEVRDFIAGE